MFVRRSDRNPIITPEMVADIAELPPTVKDIVAGEESTDMTGMAGNINGPSLIRAPPWVEDPLGEYYLYFANHQGRFLYLAYADALEGPWTVRDRGVLHVEETPLTHHIASPDVHVDTDARTVRMYYHGVSDYEQYMRFDGGGGQASGVALSDDGLGFEAVDTTFGTPYLRMFPYDSQCYFLGGRGHLYRSGDGLSDLERGPTVFPDDLRHPAVRRVGDELRVFYSNRTDSPERILRASIQLTPNWDDWSPTGPETVLEPETDYEGGNLPVSESVAGFSRTRVRQVRDPALYQEGDDTYLLYSVAGERGIAIALLEE